MGTVHVYKRRGTKNIRLSVGHTGDVRVTMPMWAPYRAALVFVTQKQDWLADHVVTRHTVLQHRQRIGKHHTLKLEADLQADKVRVRTTTTEVRVHYPVELSWKDDAVQQAASRAAHKALRQQAEQLLPARLRQLAEQHGFSFASVSVRNLKTRWGSCDSHTHITLNYYLMQLPWSLIDYVLVHELVHTKHLNHGPTFWAEFERCIPGCKLRRKQLKQYHPSITPANEA